MYTGSYDPKDLPFRKGDRVTLPKGTIVSLQYGSQGMTELQRDTVVTVSHVLPGESHRVGTFYAHGEELSWDNDIPLLTLRMYGGRYPEDLWPRVQVKEEREGVFALYLPMSNPEIVWEGSGPHWHSADINQLLETP